MTRRQKAIAAIVLALPFLVYVGWGRYFGSRVRNNELIGRTEAQICRKYGTPDTDEPGYQPLGLWTPPALPGGPIRTLRFRLGGLWHPEGAVLCVWLVEQDGVWTCFESCWSGYGVVF